jgi:hypothetical protein
VKTGRSFATASARLVQEGSERVRALATYGALGQKEGVRYVTGAPPRVPNADEAPVLRPPEIAPEIAKRFEVRYAPETSGWMRGDKHGNAELRGAIRFADGRPIDVRSLALFADAFPPPVFDVIDMSWVPTLELAHSRRGPRAIGRQAFTACLRRLPEDDGEMGRGNGSESARAVAPGPCRNARTGVCRFHGD